MDQQAHLRGLELGTFRSCVLTVSSIVYLFPEYLGKSVVSVLHEPGTRLVKSSDRYVDIICMLDAMRGSLREYFLKFQRDVS